MCSGFAPGDAGQQLSEDACSDQTRRASYINVEACAVISSCETSPLFTLFAKLVKKSARGVSRSNRLQVEVRNLAIDFL